ncbi:uncharacterized protein LOC124366698 [Homalodisca vitripennis]|uniref:uncharacterized protein LOC124366698 n=1 Tax=Homalodisca vitripennis TaxID=197043 RepID=UPI001EE9AFCD|nr:uncharacterized protein LOC124366698 [Homalodisca vitripennis]
MTVEKLLEQFVLSKYTGLEKPGCVEFEEVSVGGAVSEETKPTPAPGIKREGNASQWSGAKQSRRTTSLLNLFMPNSQGMSSSSHICIVSFTSSSIVSVSLFFFCHSFFVQSRVSEVEHGVYCVGCVEFEEVSVGGAVSEETKPTPAPGIKREGNASQWSGAKQSRRTTSLLNLFMPNSQGYCIPMFKAARTGLWLVMSTGHSVLLYGAEVWADAH